MNNALMFFNRRNMNDFNDVDDDAFIFVCYLAIKLDGCNIVGYTAWSLMDNFEWNQGYSETFGLYRVNFNDSARSRTPKDSVAVLKKIITDNGWLPQ